MVVSDETYIRMFQKMRSYRNHKTVDEDYCHALSLSDKVCRETVLVWRFLNLRSYDVRYRMQSDYEAADKSFSLKMGSVPADKTAMSVYEMLKALQCVRYQIEVDTAQNPQWQTCIKILGNAITELSDRIIGSLPEYKAARWG